MLNDTNAIIGRHTLMRNPSLAAIKEVCTTDGRWENYSNPRIDLDLLIVDESHHTRNRKNLHNAISALARSAKNVLFLTATPLHLGNEDLYNQLKILYPQRFANETFFYDELTVHQQVVQALKELSASDKQALEQSFKTLAQNDNIDDIKELLEQIDIPTTRARLRREIELFSPLSNVINRTTRRDIPYLDWPDRKAISVTHSLSEREKKYYYKLWLDHFLAIQNGVPFGKTMRLRLAATCMPIAMIKAELVENDENEEEETTDERGEMVLAGDGNQNLERLSNLPDSRFDEMMKALNEIWRETPNSKVIIFSFFVDVLDYLAIKLKKLSISHVVVHGRVQGNRTDLYDRFLDSKDNIKVLLSSEIGSEGLNLQVADTIVNYNLPWNPMVVEQRIGRIDRKGQKAKVIRIVNLFAEGTIEAKVLSRLP